MRVLRVRLPPGQTIAMRVADELGEAVRKGLGRDFVVERQLGIGGMSAVYLARELDLNRMVAVKVLPFNLSFGQEAADRFQREAKIVASLDHPHIAPIYRVGATPAFLWYSMKYIRGQSLAELLQAQPVLDLDPAIAIAEQLGSALYYAHRRGVVHRDIKPSNVLLDEDGWAFLCDFGVAKAFGSVPLTETGSTLGTPRYMSPEQCFGAKLDGRSDQYALAVLLYECLAGKPPFLAESIGEYVHKHTTVPAPLLSEARPDLPPAVSDAVARALSKSPDQRYPDAAQFVAALGGRARRSPIPLAVSASRGPQGPSTPSTPTPSLQPATRPAWRKSGRRAAALAAVAVGIVVLILKLGGGAAPAVMPASPQPQPGPAPVETVRVEPPQPAGPARAPGVLFVSTTPLGDLYIDGVRRGPSFTPNGLALPPGSHVIRVTRDGFRPFQQTIDLAPGDTLRMTRIPLRPTP